MLSLQPVRLLPPYSIIFEDENIASAVSQQWAEKIVDALNLLAIPDEMIDDILYAFSCCHDQDIGPTGSTLLTYLAKQRPELVARYPSIVEYVKEEGP